MFWIALELSIPKIGLNIMLSSTVKKLDAFKFDGVADFGNTETDRCSGVLKRIVLVPIVLAISAHRSTNVSYKMGVSTCIRET